MVPVSTTWEAQINERVNLAKLCLRTGSFTAIHTLLAHDVLAETDHAKTLQRTNFGSAVEMSASDVTNELDTINIAAVNAGQANYDSFSKKVEGLKDTTPDEAAWENVINAAAAEAKKKADQTIDDAAKKAIGVIQKLPPEARLPAANVFKSGLDKVMGFFQSVWNGINTVINAIVNFIRGVWDKLKAAAEAVANAANTAIQWIRGIFSFSAFDATWPSHYSAKTVNRELALVLDDLSRQGFEVDDFSMQKTDKGWVVRTAVNSPTGHKDGPDVFWNQSISTKTSAVPTGIKVW